VTQDPQQAGTVPVRVQVIDLSPRIVDLVVPTYLAADDLTQRIARDVGLGGWWEDGSRRPFLLRARGRVLGPSERLQDVGVVPYELLHLLPEPRQGAPVAERPLGFVPPLSLPPSRASKAARALGLLAWTALFSVAAASDPTATSSWLGGFGLALLAHHAVRAWVWGRRALWPGPLAAMATVLLIAAPLSLGVASGATAWDRLVVGGMTLLGAVTGWLGGVLVWLGPIAEPDVMGRAAAAAQAASAPRAALCGVCGLPVAQDVEEACPSARAGAGGCGLVFHAGCVRAREAVASGRGCAVCGRAA
jgi:hypothetical protein